MRSKLTRASTSAIALFGALALAACQPSEDSRLASSNAAASEQGVTAPRPEPMPGQLPDQTANVDGAIAERVTTALRADAQLRALDIDVQVEQGVVTLSGDVPDPMQQQRAMLIARSVPGVAGVRPDFTS